MTENIPLKQVIEGMKKDLINRMVQMDWFIFSCALVLSLLGILTIYSATRIPAQYEFLSGNLYIKQTVWLMLGIILFFSVVLIDYTWFSRLAYPIYGASVILLILVFFIGKKTMGAQRWIDLGIFSIQPTDIYKIGMLIILSDYLSNLRTHRLSGWMIFKIFALFIMIPLLLIIKQPDLGSGIIILGTFFVIVLMYGAETRFMRLFIIIILISVPFLWPVVWNHLKDYQKQRVVAFMNEDLDPEGIGYHIKQSKIAIGSGKITGKGYLKGTQGPLRFLPERHTDFIFSVFVEEWGFIGAAGVLVIYLLYILRGLDTAVKARDQFGRILALSISIMLSLYVVINMGMTLGIFPVVGIPLPFMSYGGSALVSNFIMAGILSNIRMRRYEIFY